MKIFLLSFVVLVSSMAHADQCQWNTPTDAESAAQLIRLHGQIMQWCQNCGDSKPSKIVDVEKVEIPKIEDKFNIGKGKEFRYVTVKIGGTTTQVDLAYTYVRTASDIFSNLAQLVGCPSDGATTFIQTTNTNKKMAHYYDANGVRVNTQTTTATSDFQKGIQTPRVPASKK